MPVIVTKKKIAHYHCIWYQNVLFCYITSIYRMKRKTLKLKLEADMIMHCASE